MTTRILQLTLLATLAWPALPAGAHGRFERGRTLVQRRCAPCLAAGWVWSPARLDPLKRPDLMTYAKSWSPAKVCTWMRRQTRNVKGTACYPGYVSPQDRLDMLYYLFRRAQAPVERPKLAPQRPFRRYQGKALKRTLAARRATVVRYHQNRLQLERMRRQTRTHTGATKTVRPPSKAPAKAQPARRRGR